MNNVGDTKMVSNGEVGETFEEQTKEMAVSEKNRLLAILDCYGVDAYKSNKEITIEETDEKIIAWHLDGVVSKSDLQAMFPLEIILALYESNKIEL